MLYNDIYNSEKFSNMFVDQRGSFKLKTQPNGPHIELFCVECLGFIRFITKKQAKRLNSINEEN